MPTVVNGIGTWHWGKRNILTRNGSCEFCGHFGTLSSFDTTLYFVVFFLPVIPISRKRVIDECPKCKRYRVASLRKWENEKTKSLLDAIEKWQSDRGDVEKALTAVGVTITYQDRPAFDDLAPAVAAGFPTNPDVQLMLASAHDHFGAAAPAEEAYRTAVNLKNDVPTRRELAKFYLRQLRPEEAQPLLADILANKDAAGTNVLLGLAQGYQATGDHTAAAKLLDEMGTAFPNLLSDAEYERIRRVSSKLKGTNKRVQIEGLHGERKTGTRESNWFQRNAAAAIIAFLVLIGSIWYFSVANRLGRHTVKIVNGTGIDYTVDIAGQKRRVAAKSSSQIDLPEGKYVVKVDDHPEIDAGTFELKTPFFSRPFNRRQYVINPDRTAVVFERVVPYSTNDSADLSGIDPPKYYVGTLLYDFQKADDVFTVPPTSVSLPSKTSVVKRRYIDHVTTVPPEVMPTMIEKQFSADAATTWLKRAAVIDRDSMMLLALLGQKLSPPEMTAFVRPYLSDRPLRLEWHRTYQSVMEREHPEYDLVAEYRAMLEKNPDDSTLIYLVARVLPDRKEAEAMFTKAAEAPKPCAYASYALANDDLCELRFAEALSRMQKARQVDPNNLLFMDLHREALEANGKLDEALTIIRGREKHDGHDYAEVSEEVRLMVAKGDPASAQERIELYCKELGAHATPELTTTARASLNVTYAYARNDVAACKAAMNDAKVEAYEWQSALMEGKFKDAEAILKKDDEDSIEPYLMLAALAGGGNDAAVADRAWAKIVDVLKKGDSDDRKLATLITSAGPNGLSPKDLTNWSSRPRERCLMFTCMGLRYPQHRPEFFSTAAKLNYSTRFPYQQLKRILGQPS